MAPTHRNDKTRVTNVDTAYSNEPYGSGRPVPAHSTHAHTHTAPKLGMRVESNRKHEQKPGGNTHNSTN